MLSPSERQALDDYVAQLRSAIAERSKLSQRIKRIEGAARGILATTEDEGEISTYQGLLDEVIEPTGFTDAIRKVLQSAEGTALTPMEIRDLLPKVGFPLSGYSNPLASVHTILKRLAKSEPIYNVEAVIKDGKPAYRASNFGERMMREIYSRAAKKQEPISPRRRG
jgi:hypothetical protein